MRTNARKTPIVQVRSPLKAIQAGPCQAKAGATQKTQRIVDPR